MLAMPLVGLLFFHEIYHGPQQPYFVQHVRHMIHIDHVPAQGFPEEKILANLVKMMDKMHTKCLCYNFLVKQSHVCNLGDGSCHWLSKFDMIPS